MADILIINHIGYITNLVSRHIDAMVEITKDTADWFAKHPELVKKEDATSKLGMAFWNHPTEPNRIVLKEMISRSEVDDHLLVLFTKGFKNVYYEIEDNEAFLKHLVLHEIAHIKHNWVQSDEYKCDQWAFEELSKIKDDKMSET
jgi:hypothetical protein